MKKGSLVITIISALALSVSVWGAEKTFPEVIQEDQSMRKNITWMTEGLYQLSKSHNKRLALT